MKWQPFEVQQRALDFAGDKPGVGWFMEMGLGKSAVTIANFWQLHENNKCDGLIVICPNSLKDNWVNELEKWGLNGKVNAAIWPKLPEKGKTPWMLVINKEAFSAGKQEVLDVLPPAMGKYRTMVALDESIGIKNPNAKLTKALTKVIAPIACYTRILSGAPVVQGPHDLWGQLKFIRALDSNFYQFRNRFCKMGGFKMKKVVGAKNEEELNALVRSSCFRARKKDWLDLPEKVFTVRKMKLNSAQVAHYENMLDEFVTYINREEVLATIVLTQMLKLQQISSGFINDEYGNAHRIPGPIAKLEELKEILEQIDGKLIVSVVYKPSLDLLLEELREYNPACIRGNDDMRRLELDVETEKARFNNDKSCRVILCQPASAKYGHTLLGNPDDRCSTTYFYENSYSLDDRLQMEDRNHRIGQTGQSVTYIDPVCSEIEAKVVKALQAKLDIATAIVDGIKKGAAQ